MRPWLKRTLIGVFGASILVGGLSACGHRMHGSAGWQMSAEDAAKWRERMLERAGKELQLDDAQKQRLGTLFDKMHDQRSALVGSTTNPRAEMATLIAGDKFDRARAQSLVEEKTGAIRAKSPEVIAALADFYDALKPEQQQKVREYLAQRHGWRG
jgi:Spy/CpxP family protein refolding chaperone